MSIGFCAPQETKRYVTFLEARRLYVLNLSSQLLDTWNKEQSISITWTLCLLHIGLLQFKPQKYYNQMNTKRSLKQK